MFSDVWSENAALFKIDENPFKSMKYYIMALKGKIQVTIEHDFYNSVHGLLNIQLCVNYMHAFKNSCSF